MMLSILEVEEVEVEEVEVEEVEVEEVEGALSREKRGRKRFLFSPVQFRAPTPKGARYYT